MATKTKTELEVITTPIIEGEIVDPNTGPITGDEADKLDAELRAAAQEVGDAQANLLSLMAEAAEGQLHLAFGYRSISDYFSQAVNIKPADAAERRLMAAMMNGKGLSQRAIAKALGVSVGTINTDLADEDKGETISTDGRTFTPKQAEEDENATAHHGQKKALTKARKAVAGAAEALAEAFGDGSHFDADITPDEIKAEIKAIRAEWSNVLATFKILAEVK